jgi:hypothetical protein
MVFAVHIIICFVLFVISDRACNPTLEEIFSANRTSTESVDANKSTVSQFDGQSIVALLIWLFAVLYSR